MLGKNDSINTDSPDIIDYHTGCTDEIICYHNLGGIMIDSTLLSRIQFGFTMTAHIIYIH